MSKLLSIIIPTRNRQIYCIESIQSILPDIDDRCEIVIQDNSSNNYLEGLVEALNNSNIIYKYNSTPKSFIDNFEEAVSLSTGKYFIILGDDDSTTKDIIPIVEWMDKEGIESLSSSFVVDYIWPNDKIDKFSTGYLSIPDYKGGSRSVDVDNNLKELIKNGFLAYQTFNLPRTYHGIIKRSRIEQVKKIGGRYFGGLTPDIYSTVALACVIKNHVIIDYPFSIAGACPASATANATIGGHAGELKDAPHFNHRGDYEWESTIPRYYSVETIWAETAIKALKDMKYPDWISLFNRYKLYVCGIYYNKKYILKLSLTETFNLKDKQQFHYFKLVNEFKNAMIGKFFRNNNRPSNANTILTDVKSIVVCKSIVNDAITDVTFK